MHAPELDEWVQEYYHSQMMYGPQNIWSRIHKYE